MPVACDFPDVHYTVWYAHPINFLAAEGILFGFYDGMFRPNAPITRAELTAVMSRFFAIASGTHSFNDIHGHWAYMYILSAYNHGWITGYGGSFRPDDPITRAEAVTIINRALGRTPNPETINYHISNTVFPDVTRTHWAYYHIIEAAIKHEYILDDDGLEIWIKTD